MKKGIKLFLIIIIVLISFIVLDTIQARIFKHSPVISWKEKLSGDSYVNKGILVDTYYCRKDDIEEVSWHFKTSKFTCPIYSKEDITSIEDLACDAVTYNKNIELEDRSIYFANCANELDADIKEKVEKTLFDYMIRSDNKKFDEVIESMSKKMNKVSVFRDGGTTVYRDENMTMIVCNKLNGNKDVYFGNSSMGYEQDMCK